ncbi:MAG: TetR/AcrR family transcriptional regulator [Acholeplasmataceae bacterium]|jgi:AcrR family transcriptional regulator|nr:TetR/AcrR family transcriptional regulator [Acholeplasmataceae bacterium]
MRATEKKILLAATKLFSESGYSGVSTRKIAEAAGVNELTLFRIFKSKSNLLQAVIRHFAFEGNIVDKIAHEITGDLKKDIQIFTDTYYMFLQNNIKMYLIQIREIDEEGLKFTNSIDYTDYMKDYFVKKLETGEFKGDPYLVATSIVSMIMGIFTMKVHAPSIYHNADHKELIDRFVQDIIRLYCV